MRRFTHVTFTINQSDAVLMDARKELYLLQLLAGTACIKIVLNKYLIKHSSLRLENPTIAFSRLSTTPVHMISVLKCYCREFLLHLRCQTGLLTPDFKAYSEDGMKSRTSLKVDTSDFYQGYVDGKINLRYN